MVESLKKHREKGGRSLVYETDPATLKKESGESKSGSVQYIDLAGLFPDYFIKSKKMPRRMAQAARRCLNHAMEEHGGLYAFAEKGGINIWFRDFPPALGKSKLDSIYKSIEQALAGDGGDDEAEPPASGGAANGQGETTPRKRRQGLPELAKIIRDGLPDNPDSKTLQMWAQRVLQDFHLQSREPFLPKDLLALGTKYKTRHRPLWYAPRQVIIGSFVALEGAPAPRSEEEKARQSFAVFVAGALSTLRMLHGDARAMVFVPLPAPLLLDHDLSVLYFACLRRLPAPVRECLCFVLQGQGRAPFSGTMEQAVTELQTQCRGIMIQTSLLAPDDYAFDGFKPLGYLMAFRDLGLQPEEIEKMTAKAAAKYKGQELWLAAQDVSTRKELGAVLSGGAGFATGPVFGQRHGRCYGMEQLDRDAIGRA